MSKYHNKKTECDNIIFDSKREAQRYCELKLMEKGGLISGLKLQPRYELIPPFSSCGKKFRKTEYVADFEYQEEGKTIIEDVKSEMTRSLPLYRLKMKLLHYNFEEFIFRET